MPDTRVVVDAGYFIRLEAKCGVVAAVWQGSDGCLRRKRLFLGPGKSIGAFDVVEHLCK